MKVNVSRLLIAAIVVAIFETVVGMLTCGGAFNWVYELEPTSVWRPMEAFSLPLMIGAHLLVNLIFVAVYAIINKGVPGENKYAKGAVYGFIVWLVGMVPGMLYTYMFMTVATTVVVYWTLSALVTYPLKGLIAAWIYGE